MEFDEEMEDVNKPGAAGSSIILNSTAEFCRTLGDIPTYGQAGNREEEAQELLVSHCILKVIFALDNSNY